MGEDERIGEGGREWADARAWWQIVSPVLFGRAKLPSSSCASCAAPEANVIAVSWRRQRPDRPSVPCRIAVDSRGCVPGSRACALGALATSATLAPTFLTLMISRLPHRSGPAEHNFERSLVCVPSVFLPVSVQVQDLPGARPNTAGRWRRLADRFTVVDEGHERRSEAASGRAGTLLDASGGLEVPRREVRQDVISVCKLKWTGGSKTTRRTRRCWRRPGRRWACPLTRCKCRSWPTTTCWPVCRLAPETLETCGRERLARLSRDFSKRMAEKNVSLVTSQNVWLRMPLPLS